MKSFWKSAASRRTPPCGWRATLAPARKCGRAYKPITTCAWCVTRGREPLSAKLNPWPHCSRSRHKMALTRDYNETVVARIKRDRKFARALYAEALSALMDGETAEGLCMRDLVHAEITFKELSRQTGLGEKTLHRMLNRNGNPTARNLGVIVKSIAEDLGIKARVEVAAAS